MKLSATYRMVGHVMIVHCRGRIIFGDEIEELSKEVSSKFQSKQRQVVLHLGEVEGVRRGDLGTLWLGYMSARALGWNIRFCKLRVDLRRLLQSTGIEDVFDIYDDEEQAVASFAQPYLDDPQYDGGAISGKAS